LARVLDEVFGVTPPAQVEAWFERLPFPRADRLVGVLKGGPAAQLHAPEPSRHFPRARQYFFAPNRERAMPWFSRRPLISSWVLLALFVGGQALAKQRVPFVGCPSDGMSGHVDAPRGGDRYYEIDAAAASQLAYYQAQDSLGVLAPRGWTCLFIYGSDGDSLRVLPSGDLHGIEPGFDGPAVLVVTWDGESSGRGEVARYAARLFPRVARSFIHEVIALGIEPKGSFPFGPYPADKLTYKSARMVEFTTPANKDGLGTSGALKKSELPIRGVAVLADSSTPGTPNFVLLTARLPATQAKLIDAIINAAE
jgi:hypothetical protein